jgi:hypothetical protein
MAPTDKRETARRRSFVRSRQQCGTEYQGLALDVAICKEAQVIGLTKVDAKPTLGLGVK